MKICSREYQLKFKNGLGGGEFYCDGKHGGGKGLIVIENYKETRRVAEVLCHEILEAILVEDYKRFACTSRELSNPRYFFQFSHDYLDTVGQKLLDALLTSGFFKLMNGRQQRT